MLRSGVTVEAGDIQKEMSVLQFGAFDHEETLSYREFFTLVGVASRDAKLFLSLRNTKKR